MDLIYKIPPETTPTGVAVVGVSDYAVPLLYDNVRLVRAFSEPEDIYCVSVLVIIIFALASVITVVAPEPLIL